MILITLNVPEEDLKMLDELVKQGKYPSRAEAIRIAIKELLRSEHPKYSMAKGS